MDVLVVGASGATGSLLVEQLLNRGSGVRAIVRSEGSLPKRLREHAGLSVIEANILDLEASDLARHVKGCRAVASCLGHNLSFSGIFGSPRQLVTDATRRLCAAIEINGPVEPVKFVLMNTTGNSNRDLDEPVSLAQRAVITLLRLCLPPHRDNEDAADYLRTQVGQGNAVIQWAVVRPDGLTDEASVSATTVHPSPTRSAIFDAGKTSRINVASFMADLIGDDSAWSQWQGKMPVIYNETA